MNIPATFATPNIPKNTNKFIGPACKMQYNKINPI